MVYFFDTSALQFRYKDGPTAGGHNATGIRRIISDERNECYISDVTVLEIASAWGTYCRSTGLGVKKFDRLERSFMKDLAAERLRVRTATGQDIIRARSLLRFAGVIRGKRLGSADALVATCCLDLALERHERVTFCLEDWGLYSIVKDIDAFRAAVKFKFVGRAR